MADLGKGVSYVYDAEGYNYDMVVFQKGKPPLDSELNLSQELQNLITQRNLRSLPSGWLSSYPFYADQALAPSSTSELKNKFYTQNPSGAKPEFALVNGMLVYVTNTNGAGDNANLIDVGTPPITGNRVDGVILEVWRALLDPMTSTNKPIATTFIDSFNGIYAYDLNHAWICGTNGLILATVNGGETWPVMPIDTKRSLNGIHFYNLSLGWVVGDNGLVARTSSGGKAWSLLVSATTANLNSVHAVSQTIVWAVGESGTILKASNGVTFVQMTSSRPNNLNKVYFCDSTNGWIVGDDGLILLTTNGGVTWTQSVSGTTNNLNSVYFYNKNFGFAVGDNGTILSSSDGGVTWINRSTDVSGGAITNNLYDVTMFPKLDEEVLAEEVSSQLGATGTSFIVANKPITGADRKGIVTNNPADVIVRVNGTAVTVLNVNGLNGTVVLASAPGLGATTTIHYYYQSDCAVFQGKAWAVGSKGKILYTEDIGATWSAQTSGTGYDLKSVSFVSQTAGWVSGSESVILVTGDGSTWSSQQSDVFARQMQRIYTEGNTGSVNDFLEDNSIHPDAAIETTKRVQIQYKIRVLEGVDPLSYSEAGLNSNVLGLGPNTSGSFQYQNMGSINGDYGCWQAQCNNTVDGYVYAIPMFFVARRNSNAYSTSNPNGEHKKNTSSIRPDFLLSTNVVSSDILDVRRNIGGSSTEEIYQKTFDALCSNTLKTNFGRNGDQYGTEILHVDILDSDAITEAIAGTYSSESDMTTHTQSVSTIEPLPGPTALEKPSTGLFSPRKEGYKAIYSGTGSYNGRLVPGDFYGQGSSDASFVFNDGALPAATSGIGPYFLKYDFIKTSQTGLSYSPYEPVLTRNSTTGFNYQGVLESDGSRVIEKWSSSVEGYNNYAVVYSIKDPSDSTQQHYASPVEVHYFMTVPTTSNVLTVNRSIVADSDSSNIPYNIYTISKINNKTANFSHKIENQVIGTTSIQVVAVAGYEFVAGTVVEVVSSVISSSSSTNIRNGAAVNLFKRTRGISNFTKSMTLSGVASSGSVTFTPPNSELVLGWSTAETSSSLNQAICWSNDGSMAQATPVLDADYGAVVFNGTFVGGSTMTTQVFLQQTDLTGSMNVGYRYLPYQTQGLSTTLSIIPVSVPKFMYVSTAGSGGGTEGVFDLPIENIPLNDTMLSNDNVFSNLIEMQFSNFVISGGFIQLPVLIPANFVGSDINLSGVSYDSLERFFYANCNPALNFYAEGLQSSVSRKMFVPFLARITDDNTLFKQGEYVLVVCSAHSLTGKENVVGSNCVSIYRTLNRNIVR